MARYTGPKHKLARREGVNIFDKDSASLERRLNVKPGSHGRYRRTKTTEYGLQLREKQKLKRIYGILEKQFRKYINLAEKSKLNTDEALVQRLETRLDNVVYRLGFARSRAMARQLVSHVHILVNGKKINIPSYQVKVDDEITISEKFLKNEINKLELEESSLELLPFVVRKKNIGKLKKLPEREEVPNPVDYQLVIEFYSR